MRIKEVNENMILFDNGNSITFDHEQDCCEQNYADFEQLDDIARITEFDPNLDFIPQGDVGFLFGNVPNKMFFVPCYSRQNGYYSTDIAIYYNGELATYLNCQEDFDG